MSGSDVLSRVQSPEAEARLKRQAGQGSDDEIFRIGRPPEVPAWQPGPATRMTDRAGIRIETLDLHKKSDRRRFIDMPAPIYRGDLHYIAPLRLQMNKFLDPARNPAFETIEVNAFVAYDGARPVGRMSAQIDRTYNDFHESQTGFFGFFESINDRKVAHAVLDHGLRWLRERGMKQAFGPANFTLNHQVGLLVENFDRPPFVEQTYNPRYYEELLTSYGLAKAKDLLVWWTDTQDGMDSKNRKRIDRISRKIQEREGIRIRHVDLSRAKEEMELLFELYVQAWQKNWGFAPVSKQEFMWIASDLKEIILPELVLFVEVGDQTVGFSTTLPNVNERMPKDGRLLPWAWTKLLFGGVKKVKTGRLITLGTLPEYRKRGLEAMMFRETLLRARDLGIVGGEIGWTLEDNDLVNRAIETMDGWVDRRYRLLGVDLDADGPPR